MKNIISKCVILLSIALLFSCSKELEYGSDFNFKINNIDNNSIILNSEKTFELELSDFFNQNNDKTFKLSYNCDSVDLIDGNLTLLQGNDYSFSFNELSKLPLKLKATKQGDFTLTIYLTDINGLKKEQQVVVKVIEDLNFSFNQEQALPNYEDVLSTTFNFSFKLQSTGSGGDSYKIKALPSLSGTVLINNALVAPKELVNVAAGNITVVFTPDMIGKQSLTLVVVNSKNVEKEVTLELVITQKVFTVTASNNFEVKETLNKQFSFITEGTIPNWTYQVKFKSTTNAKIYSSVGVLIPLDTYVDLPVNSSTFNFIYEATKVGVDPLEITVKDKNNQTVVKNITVTGLSKPIFALTARAFLDPGTEPYNLKYLSAFYNFEYVEVYGQNVTIAQYEFKVFNYKTKVIDTYTEKTKSLYTFELYTPSNNEESEKLKDFYGNQKYTARIKDSDGVWSETISGTMAK